MAFQEKAHGPYLIKHGPRGLISQAKAFLNGKPIGDTVEADSEELAIAELQARLDDRDAQIAAGRGDDGTPSALEYAEAFNRIAMSAGQEAMLQAHLDAPDHCITATQLADAAGYENWSAANLQYGLLGQKLAEEMNYNPPLRADGSTIWTATIAGWDESPDHAKLDRAMERREDDEHFEWLMRPQVVEALKRR